MISTVFSPVYSGNEVINMRLTIYFSGMVLATKDYPPETEMDDSAQYAYVITKLSPLFA